MNESTLQSYYADSPPSVVPLLIKPHFEALNEQQKLYAHYLSLASFSASRVVLRQVSPESEHIYDLIITLHDHCNGDWKTLAQETGLSESELQAWLDYAAQFLGNMGNYKSFGDSKFVPRIEPSKVKALASSSPKALQSYEKTSGAIFATKDAAGMHLGYPDAGHVSTYYPGSLDITQEEISTISEFLVEEKKLLPENTRLRKTAPNKFQVLVASGESNPSKESRDIPDSTLHVNGQDVKLVFGDHSREMAMAAENLEHAQKHAANDTQVKMCQEYAKSFRTGSLEAFKQSQRYWIQDKGPTVETDIGFIETYRDPHGIRGEWEGFVAMVNQERTRAFRKLVEAAPELIPRLPWTKDFEKQKFLSPDFTSLEVLTFAGSGIPAGINIPNYDDIRQTEGFKNVSLGNVLSAKAPNEPIPFIKESDRSVYEDCRDAAFEVQVGLHELLGHGCGKLLQETESGKFNFDSKNPPRSPIDNTPVSSYYKPGQTWGGVFGSLAASYEECRAECVAMVLSCDFDILSIFGIGDGNVDLEGPAGDVLHAAYLQMARAGVIALEFWDPTSRKWGQAHMQARFSILQTFLSAGKDFCRLEYEKDDLDDLTIFIDRHKILSHGRPAVEAYLQKLHIYKATADVQAGRELYEGVTMVDDWWGTKVRPVVLRKKTPRKVFVQSNTVIEDGKVVLKEYDATQEGMIKSYAERSYI